jgi:hypothetical protein
VIERTANERLALLLDQGTELIQIALDHQRDQAFSILEILVQRAHGHARTLCNACGGQPAIADGKQNLNTGLTKSRHCRL